MDQISLKDPPPVDGGLLRKAMTREELCSKKQEALDAYMLPGRLISCEKYGNGHINDTYLVNPRSYILQRINTNVFTNPDELIENIDSVKSFLRKKNIEMGRRS